MFKRYGLVLRLLPYIRIHKGRFALLVLFTIVAAIVGLFEPWPFALLIDTIIERKSAFPSWLGFVGGWGVVGQILFAVMLGFGFTLLQHGMTVLTRFVDTRLELNIVLDLRSRLFEHIQRLSFQYHDQTASSRYIFLVNQMAHSAGTLLTGFIPLAQAFLTLGGMFFIVYRLDPQLAMAATAVVPFVYYTTRTYGRRIEPRLLSVRRLEAESLRIVYEKLSIVKVVVSFCRERYEHARFRRQAEESIDARVRLTVIQTAFSLGIGLITAAGTALVLFIGARAAARGDLTVGQLTVVLAYVAAVYQPIEQITNTLATNQQQLVQLDVVFKTLDTAPDIRERPDARPLGATAGRIELREVSFHYSGRVRTVEDVDVAIDPGEFVAIVGPTGAGKSTLVSLIPRYVDAQKGRVFIDGQDVKDLTLASLRGAVSVVMQEPILFMGTITENIRYGRLDASDDEVVAAAKAANCHDFIAALPDGYETELGERGAGISGGERQRIAVARAFLKDAPILILDEPTSSIDSRTEAVILEALERLAEGRTTIMIAHRLSTIRRADRILVMDGGHIVEHGTHPELIAGGGLYTTLWRTQMGEEAPSPEPEPPHEPDETDEADVDEVTAGEWLTEKLAEVAAVSDAPIVDEPAARAPGSPDLRPAAAGPVDAPAPSPGLFSSPGQPGSFTVRRRPKVVLLGMMTKIPVAGVVWQTIHYLVGLERLGIDAYYVECHARTPSMFMERDDDDASARAASFLDDVMHRFGLDGRWAFDALHDVDGHVYGMDRSGLERLYREADLIINLHGATQPLPEHSATGRLIYVETDPVQLQIELHNKEQASIDFLEQHVAYFTFGENYGQPDCGLPVSDRFQFLPTRQPVICDFWEPHGRGLAESFTTVGNWRQPWRSVKYLGETYHWTKHLEFLKLVELPRQVPQRLELALSSYTDDDRCMLESQGWNIVHGLDVSVDIDRYRDYVGASRGEFTVAKDQNVRLRSGWFSDRSATYLAAGRPVVTQDTGFGNVLPTGDGLLAFSTPPEVVEALAHIDADYDRHRDAARSIARDYFDHDVVLRPLLGHAGVELPRTHHRTPADANPAHPLAHDVDLTVVRRHPTTLRPETVAAILDAPLPAAAPPTPSSEPAVSVVVVTHDNLVFTRLCIESLLVNTRRLDVEIIVVDNASTDMTSSYVAWMAARFPSIRVLQNDTNAGFAPAANQGLSVATGEMLVLLNNDTIVPPGWIDGLERHLQDPGVGLVGPVTNAAPNEARIDVPYTTYRDFVRYATERSRVRGGDSFDVGRLTMFCVAMRREVFEHVGPLDERFEIGMFEDDDYALRIQATGLRQCCAEDVVVHHFGEASLGKLVHSGEYSRIFQSNRERFERKWGTTWEAHRGRPDVGYEELVATVQSAVAAAVPDGSTVLVVTRGDDSLLDVPGRTMQHFPQDDDGGYAGWYPGATAEVVEQLDRLVADRGASHIVFPETSSWWFEFYGGLETHFTERYDEIEKPAGCRIFCLREPTLVTVAS